MTEHNCPECPAKVECPMRDIMEWRERLDNKMTLLAAKQANREAIKLLTDIFINDFFQQEDKGAAVATLVWDLFDLAYYEGRQYKGGQLLEI